MTDTNTNITFFIEEEEDENENANEFSLLDLENINKLLNDDLDTNHFDITIPQIVDYSINYTIKGLLAICDYYGIAKNLKNCKSNKEQIIDSLVLFENEPNNHEIVMKRKRMWFYIDELKKDKIMKKYILFWN
jgi:hypothetical protein